MILDVTKLLFDNEIYSFDIIGIKNNRILLDRGKTIILSKYLNEGYIYYDTETNETYFSSDHSYFDNDFVRICISGYDLTLMWSYYLDFDKYSFKVINKDNYDKYIEFIKNWVCLDEVGERVNIEYFLNSHKNKI